MKRKPKKERAFFSIRFRLMAMFCALGLVLLGLVWGVIANFMEPLYQRYIYNHLSAQVNLLASIIEASDRQISTRSFASTEIDTDFLTRVSQLESEGRLDFRNCCVDVADSTLQYVIGPEGLYPCLLHDSGSSGFSLARANPKHDTSAMLQIRQEIMMTGSYTKLWVTASGARQMVVGKLVQNGDWGAYTVVFSTSLARVDEAVSVVSRMMPMIFVCLLLLLIPAAWWFSRWFTNPLTKLSHAARKIADGDYTVQVDVDQNDEIGLLANDFNHMASQVATAAQLQRDLLANVSHDLRTPLTLIKGYAETVRDLTGGDEQKRTEQLNVIVDETDRLSGLVNSVMELSKVSSGVDAPQRVVFDIAQLCDEVAQRYEAVCAQEGCTLQLQADVPCDVLADPGMMERVLHNLLGNALHHIGPDRLFVLRVTPLADGTGARVEVEDHGEGIAKIGRAHV